MKALNKDPEKRYESCAELHHDLQLYLDGRFPMKCPSTALKRMSQSANHFIDDHPKKAVVSILAASVVLIAGIVIAMAMFMSG